MGDDLAERVAAAGASVRARWAALPTLDDAFLTYLRERASRQPDLGVALPRLRIEDLALAWWASRGDSAAIAAFEAAHAEDLAKLLRRFHRLDPDELTQLLRIKLFIGSETAPPRILEYSGFGFLQNWYKVIAVRTFLDAARSKRRERTDELADEQLLALVDQGDDPREAATRAELIGAIKRALAAAIAELPGRERTFLRHVTVDGLTLEQIAATYELHRVTVARTLASARKQLHEATRELVIAELGIAPDGLESAIQQLDSQIDLSLRRVFRDPIS
jgi:RNA polymerase sigma-70 factor